MTLLPCPFCGSDNLSIATGDLQPDDLYEAHVCCENCSATGSNVCWYETEEEAESEAIAAWNRRAVPEGYALVPVELNHTVKAALIGEYMESCNVSCPECLGEGCDDCDEGVVEQLVTVGWDTTKQIYKDAIKALVEEQLRSKP